MKDGAARILLIDDEEAMCRMLEAVMSDHGYAVTCYTKPEEALAAFSPKAFDVVVTDVKMPGVDGLEVLERIRGHSVETPVIMISGHATVEMSIQALRKGAYDMLVKPFEPDELLSRVRNAVRQSALREENEELKAELENRFEAIVGSSHRLLAVLETARKVASRDIPVLVTGESGTGKELLARAIHRQSNRRERPFVAINCGAIAETLLESELFGHRKGAFTGADRDHEGLVAAADKGTLFLDEIGTLPMNVQTTLLRFLQNQEFYRVGDTRPRQVDVRIVSATNMDLAAGITAGRFREDLFYRLNVVNIRLPSLRERREDIPLLAAHFVRQQNRRFSTSVRGFTPEALRALQELPWPGNVRQLENVVSAVMAIESDQRIGLPALAQVVELPAPGSGSLGDIDQLDYNAALARFETEYLGRLLRKNAGAVEAVAHQAGMNVATIYRKLKKYSIR